MTRRLDLPILLAPVVIIVITIVGAFVLLNIRSGESAQPTLGLRAAAELWNRRTATQWERLHFGKQPLESWSWPT